jgi:hypothetical protein
MDDFVCHLHCLQASLAHTHNKVLMDTCKLIVCFRAICQHFQGCDESLRLRARGRSWEPHTAHLHNHRDSERDEHFYKAGIQDGCQATWGEEGLLDDSLVVAPAMRNEVLAMSTVCSINFTNSLDLKTKKRKQIGISHTRGGIGHGRQPAGQVEGKQKEGKWRSKARKALVQERNLSIMRRQHQKRSEGGSGSFIITVGRQGSISTSHQQPVVAFGCQIDLQHRHAVKSSQPCC